MADFLPGYYLRHDQVAARLGGADCREVVEEIRAGAFGLACIRRGRFFYVPEAGFNQYIAARTIHDADGRLKPLHARTAGEFQRKVAA